MIEDLIRVFEKRYRMYGDDLLLEDYKLEDGIYVLYNVKKIVVLIINIIKILLDMIITVKLWK